MGRTDKTKWMLQLICVGALAGGSLTGCRVNSDEVEYWKGSVKGPTRLIALLGSDKYSDELRTEAALAMVEMDRNDVNGLALLDEALEDLQREDKRASEAIVAAMAPKLEAVLAEEAPQGEDEGLPAEQVRAKDAAYMVIPYAPEELRPGLVESVVSWYSKDFAGRSLSGDYSAEQVTRALGAPAASMLVDGMHSKMPRQALIKIAEIVGEGGDAETKKRAAEKLVEMERDMEKKPFLDWLSQEIEASMKAAGEPADAARVRALALYNRETYINEGVLPAMRQLADQELVSTRLMQIADTKPAPGDPEAWVARLNERRAKALGALEGHVTRTDLNRLLSIALDSSNPIEVRDYAFDRVGDVGSRDAIPRLWPLVESVGCSAASCSESDQLAKRLRWRAGELVLAAGGTAVIAEFSERLPDAPGVQYEPEELTGYARRMSQMTPPPTQAASKLLNSAQWWNRVIALRYLERRGTEADIPRMQKMVSDGAVLAGEGWAELEPPIKTVGEVANSSIASLKTREQDD